MSCPRCGEVCCCSSEPATVAVPEESNLCDTNSPIPNIEQEHDNLIAADPAFVSSTDHEMHDHDDSAWREEVAATLNRYRARRKPRPPRYPSLRLRFEEPADSDNNKSSAGRAFEAMSHQALALDRLGEIQQGDPGIRRSAASDVANSETAAAVPQTQSGLPSRAKIIEFPRMDGTAPPSPLDELAEPVNARPRILEALEVALPAPALGGITIEDTPTMDAEKRPGFDTPLQSAPLTRRVLAAATDGLIVMAASLLFGGTFWKVAAIRPPMAQIVGLAAAVPPLFWAAYQYLLIVYSGSTPGLRLAALELTRFDGSRAGRKLRRWRILASYLSAASLGMGYAWVLLDEDRLCWHDRITHTYLAPKQR